jgi:opacity protein-like surface antigen
MRRFLIAAALAAALGPPAAAQPVPEMTPPIPPPPAVYKPNVYVPPGTPPGPAIPFHKSTGVVVGAYGLYPYDTGEWLLGGTEGFSRQSGSFTMVYPGLPVGTAVSTPRKHTYLNHPLFRR